MFYIFNLPREYPKTIAAYWDQFNFYDGRDAWLRSIADIPEKVVNLYAVHWAHAEIENGGFGQYFFNSTGTSWPEAVRGFEAIGMPNVASILRHAGAKLGNEFPGTQQARREIVRYFDEDGGIDFDELDNAFWSLACSNNLIFRKQPKFVPFADAYAARN